MSNQNGPSDRDIDAQLRAAFSPPDDARFEQIAEQATKEVAKVHRPLWQWFTAAAAALLVIAMWLDRAPRGPEGHDSEQLGAVFVAAYDQAIDSGFTSGSCCQPSSDLAAECERWCGKRLLHGGDNGAEVLGCYCGGPTGGCLGVMLHVEGDPVCVFVVPREHDPRPTIPQGRDLAMSRRELGPFVLYALSQSQRDGALAGFSVPSS